MMTILTKKSFVNFSLTVFLSFLLISVSPFLSAQGPTGHILGVVRDASGGVIPKAMIAVTNVDTGVKRVLATNDSGAYSAPRLQSGTYNVEAEFTGFKKYERRAVVVGAASNIEVDIVLEVGMQTETVSVTSQVPLVETSSGVQRTSVDLHFLDLVPLGGRDSNTIVRLVPGAVLAYTSFAVNYRVNGTRDTSNSYMLDGTDASDPYNAGSNKLPPPDSLKEFSVRNNFSAEYGRGGGAVVALTKSGTNQLHGSFYDYFRSENLNANTFQRNATGLGKGDFKYHQRGFSAGGPVYLPKVYDGRNRSFFFVSRQVLQTPASSYLWARGGLTQSELTGDFSKSKVIPSVSTAAAAAPRSPFSAMAGQKLPNISPYLSQTARHWYEFLKMPIATNSGDYWYESKTQNLNLPEWTMRFDHTIKQKNTLSFSMYYRNDAPDVKYLDYTPEQFRTVNTFNSQHYTFSDILIISPKIVNELMAGYNRIWETRVGVLGNAPWKEFGFSWQQMDPMQCMTIPNTLSPSQFNLNYYSPRYEGRDVVDFRDTVSFNFGNHFMKAGAKVQLQNTTYFVVPQARYDYSGNWLGNRAAEFLIGWPDQMYYAAEDTYSPAR